MSTYRDFSLQNLEHNCSKKLLVDRKSCWVVVILTSLNIQLFDSNVILYTSFVPRLSLDLYIFSIMFSFYEASETCRNVENGETNPSCYL